MVFKLGAIFPYDLQALRSDWVNWINVFDYPCVYSKYGAKMLEGVVPKIKYFRPMLNMADTFQPTSEEERSKHRAFMFPDIEEDTIVFGSIGVNQIRKDPQRLIKAFSLAKKEIDRKCILYLHTGLKGGVFNLKQYGIDCGLEPGDMRGKPENMYRPHGDVSSIYHALDCFVNCSMQEGLSWTIIESMLCGTPFIASYTTAHKELLDTCGYSVPCEDDSEIPLFSANRETWIDAKRCSVDHIKRAMVMFGNHSINDKSQVGTLVMSGKNWVSKCSNVNALIAEAVISRKKPPKIITKKDGVLFAQHSSAGDVFMTTRCFKGLVERHGTKIDYMTSKQFIPIVEGNKYINKVLPWDRNVVENGRAYYKHYYNPHGEKILPGSWGRNCNSILSDFYWKILKVEPDDFFIKETPITRDIEDMIKFSEILALNKPIAILHTTGGDSHFRNYKYMKDVVDAIKDKYYTIQMGASIDEPAWTECDLRGKLTFNEVAFIMSYAKIAVTVDSFMSHLSGAYGVSQVCLFGSGNHNVVKPNQVSGALVMMVPDYLENCKGLGPCSQSVRDCPIPCTNIHDPKDIVRAIHKIEKWEELNEEIGSRIEYLQ